MTRTTRCAAATLALALAWPLEAQRRDDRPFGWYKDSAGVVQFTMVASPQEWSREGASAEDVSVMRGGVESFVRLLVRQPAFAPPLGFQPHFVVAPTDHPDNPADTAPLRALVAFGAYPFVIRWRSVQEVGGPGEVSIPASTSVLTMRVNHFSPSAPAEPLSENDARPALFGDWPVATGRLGPFVVYDEGLLIVAREGAPLPWRAMTVERALHTLCDRYRAWSAAWSAEVEHNPKGYPLPAIRGARDSVQRRTSSVLAQVDDRLARMTATERAASACHLREPSVAGRVDSHIRAMDDAPPGCMPMAEENPAMFVSGRGRAALHFVEITGFRPCIELLKVQRPADGVLGTVACRSMLDMLGGAPWEDIRQLLGSGGGR